jgi:hypothetical protein
MYVQTLVVAFHHTTMLQVLAVAKVMRMANNAKIQFSAMVSPGTIILQCAPRVKDIVVQILLIHRKVSVHAMVTIMDSSARKLQLVLESLPLTLLTYVVDQQRVLVAVHQ